MIRITSDTDDYYCIIKLSYPPLLYDFCVTVTIPDILILLLWGNSSCMDSGYGDMRYMIYIWEFSCLNYPLDVSISWIQSLSSYNWF